MSAHQYSHPTAIADAVILARIVDVIPGLMGDIRSDHAGETGAVMIYRGILAGTRSTAIRDFARMHLVTERQHLAQFAALLPLAERSVLLPLWQIAGWLTGFLPALVGDRAVYVTIDAVETFVDQHYEDQVRKLPAQGPGGALRSLLIACQADEVHHRDEARAANIMPDGFLERGWRWLVATGSALAVAAARRL